jgi:hypothetical protein
MELKLNTAASPGAVQALNDLKIAAKLLYAELLPTLGYDFLSQFDDCDLLEFYLQCIGNNIELILEQF